VPISVVGFSESPNLLDPDPSFFKFYRCFKREFFLNGLVMVSKWTYTIHITFIKHVIKRFIILYAILVASNLGRKGTGPSKRTSLQKVSTRLSDNSVFFYEICLYSASVLFEPQSRILMRPGIQHKGAPPDLAFFLQSAIFSKLHVLSKINILGITIFNAWPVD
jgi:hypothetical protein